MKGVGGLGETGLYPQKTCPHVTETHFHVRPDILEQKLA